MPNLRRLGRNRGWGRRLTLVWLPHTLPHAAGIDTEAPAQLGKLDRFGEEIAIALVTSDFATSRHTTFLSADSLAITQMSLNTRAL
jgi:hypothetical protein